MMPLATEVGLSAGDMVLDGAPALPMAKGSAVPFPHFSAQFVLAQSPISATAQLS